MPAPQNQLAPTNIDVLFHTYAPRSAEHNILVCDKDLACSCASNYQLLQSTANVSCICPSGNYLDGFTGQCKACPSQTFQPDVEQASCLQHTVCEPGTGVTTAATPTSDRICEALCVLEVTYFNASTARCENVTVCPPGAAKEPVATLVSDHRCAPSAVPCIDGLTPNSTACTCPADIQCSSCTLQDGFGATLRLYDALPTATEQLGSCVRPELMDTVDLYHECLALCDGNTACVAFHVQPGERTCCFYQDFVDSGSFALADTLFYSMPHCERCAEGHFPAGRRCQLLDKPPSVLTNGSAASVQKLSIPLAASVGTTLLSFEASLDDGAGMPHFAIEESSTSMSITGAGRLFLDRPFLLPGTISVTIAVSDNRTSCTRAAIGRTPIVTQGPCTTRILVNIEVGIFLGCPSIATVYTPLDTTVADVHWETPRLPASLENLNVTVDLGDTASTFSPYTYNVGSRTVRYESEPLSIGGRVVCEFDVVVRTGVSVNVMSIARTATNVSVQEFLLVEVTESNAGARLPSFDGPLESKTLSIGLLAPRGLPFSVSPQVS